MPTYNVEMNADRLVVAVAGVVASVATPAQTLFSSDWSQLKILVRGAFYYDGSREDLISVPFGKTFDTPPMLISGREKAYDTVKIVNPVPDEEIYALFTSSYNQGVGFIGSGGFLIINHLINLEVTTTDVRIRWTNFGGSGQRHPAHWMYYTVLEHRG